MTDEIKDPLTPDKSFRARLLIDMITRMVVHHGLWFTEVRHQMGLEKALAALETATQKSVSIGLKRCSDIMGFPMEDGLPKALKEMDAENMEALIQTAAKNWLVTDGVWFQAIEFVQGMNDAKRCNDSCWAQFSPYEAFAVKRLLNLDDQCGLEGLKQALGFRMYSFINKQSIVDEGPKSFVFHMNDCRVQSARKRKNLDDYPCKSAGLVEYAYFASAMDKRITTECIGCPPDHHPEEWFCAWRFRLNHET
jgi:hypothetical protein